MFARVYLVAILILSTILFVLTAGCGGNDPVAPGHASSKITGARDALDPGSQPSTGAVVIDILPGSLEPTWTLNGPAGFTETGEGKQILLDADPGEYTLSWGDLIGWDTPAPSSLLLESGDMITLSGAYLAIPATTPDEAVQLFRDTYSGRLLERYRALLGADFQFVGQDGGNDDHDQEIVIADRMFNEREGEGGIIIGDIAIDALVAQGVWSQTPANDPVFGMHPESQYRPYLGDIKFFVAGQNLILRVQGPVIIYLERVGDQDYRILGIVDMTYGNKATEDTSWTSVRNLFE